MKSIDEIVKFYDDLKNIDLFPNSVFNIDQISIVEKRVVDQNELFF